VIERHAAIEFHLRRGVAVDLELYFAEALGSSGVSMRRIGGSLAGCTGRSTLYFPTCTRACAREAVSRGR
jgi:hypothetical protein